MNKINQTENIYENSTEEAIDILWALENSNNIIEKKVIKIKAKQLTLDNESVFNEVLTKKVNNTDPLEDNYIEKKTKKLNSFLSAGIFWLKYIVTSVFIFSVLLLTTNYAAYTNIVKSYIYKDEIKEKRISLINWAEASNIIETSKQDKEIDNIVLNSAKQNYKISIPNRKTKEDKMKILVEKQKQTYKEWKKFSITKLISNLKNEEINLWINIIPYENRIVIPKIGQNVPLIDIKEEKVKWKKQLDNIFMKELEYGIIRYPGSAKPWEKWNSFIFWHSSNFPWIAWDYNDVFSRLGQLEKWDIVYSYYWQKRYKYKITTKEVIKPNDVSILKRDKNRKELTLMTCWPVWTTLNRLILIWELIEE